jgi:hypothetical protein
LRTFISIVVERILSIFINDPTISVKLLCYMVEAVTVLVMHRHRDTVVYLNVVGCVTSMTLYIVCKTCVT